MKILIALIVGFSAYSYYQNPDDNFLVNSFNSVYSVFADFYDNLQGTTEDASQRNQDYKDTLDSL